MAAPQGWSKLYNDLPDHPKFVRAGYQAGWLYICGQCYCSQNLTDGRIPKAIVNRLSSLPKPFVAVRQLVTQGLWHDCGDYYEQHDYTEMQRTAAQVNREREINRERQQRGRMSRRDSRVTDTVTHGVTHGDVTFTESESEKSTSKSIRVKSPPTDTAVRCLAAWSAIAPLPQTAKESRALQILDECLRIDKLSEERLLAICQYAAREWVPQNYIQTPASLREETKKSKIKTWEAIERQMSTNGKPKEEHRMEDTLKYLAETSQ